MIYQIMKEDEMRIEKSERTQKFWDREKDKWEGNLFNISSFSFPIRLNCSDTWTGYLIILLNIYIQRL